MFRNPAIDAIVVLIIVLLIAGPKRLPGLGKGLGQGMREFKEGISGDSRDDEAPGLNQAAAMPETQAGAEHPTPSASEAGTPRSS
jgi:sec-independent protein translocase protein TatA